MSDEPENVVLQQLDRMERRFDAVDEKLDDNKRATNGVAMIVTMLAGHVHHIDERLEAVERHLGAAGGAP